MAAMALGKGAVVPPPPPHTQLLPSPASPSEGCARAGAASKASAPWAAQEET